MQISAAYLPHEIFAPYGRADVPPPRVFIAPQRVALLTSERGSRKEGVSLRDALHAAGIESVASIFNGEMVAMGTLTQLMMEERPDEGARVAEFFSTVGLPIHLGQLSLDAGDSRTLDVLVEGTLAFPFIANMPQPITVPLVRSAIVDAHGLGISVTEKIGDAAYRRIQA